MTENIFVLGLDEANRAMLSSLPGTESYEFHQLLTFDELQGADISVPDLLAKAQRQLDSFDGSIDAVVGYLDFPVSMMVPVLCDRYGLTSADLESVVKCEHKYWSRVEQQKVIDEHPGFALLNLNEEHATLPSHTSYPAWIKPVVSHSSQGAHYVENDDDFQWALGQERSEVEKIGRPFADVLAMLDLPQEIADSGGAACMVEEAAVGKQFTVEGYSRGDHIEVYGVVDSVTYEDSPSFLRYQYPTMLPSEISDYMIDVSRKVIKAVGLTNSTFNIEYFWDPETEKLRLLEVNARHSQSHAMLFEMVDGVSNHAAMLSLALDRDPYHREDGGPYNCSAKWFLRRFADGLVTRVPTAEEIAEVEKQVPGTTIEIAVEEGAWLSEGGGDGSFSFGLAQIFTSGDDEADLIDKYNRCLDTLEFGFEDREEAA
ncbi:MAG: ATP-grasp domain-containing protein [Nesterenkonia sp.]